MTQNYIERYWRDATPEDAIKEPPMVARFQDGDGEWKEKNFRLLGWARFDTRNSGCLWYSDGVGCYRYCQVYDAPDPGEGWRLIDVDTETPKEDDHYLCPTSNVWCFCNEYLRRVNYSKDSIVRRRIEQPKPEPRYEPFRWEDREQLRGRLVTYFDRNRTVEFRCESFAVDDDGLIVNDAYADWLCKHAVFVDTKEPVGKKVMK